MLKKTTQLTKDGVKSLMEKNFKNSYFQMIEMNNLPIRSNMPTTTAEKPTEKFKVTISDGFAKTKTFFASEACKMITTGIATNFCVFEIISAVINITDKTMIIVVKIAVIYEEINEIIGKPIEFDEYRKMNFQNPQGSLIIPLILQKSNEIPDSGFKPDAFGSKIPQKTIKPINPQQNFNSNVKSAFPIMNKFANNNTNNSFNNNDEDNQNLMTIAMLSPVSDASWKIKARVLKKNDIKQYKNAKGEGCFFTIEIMDRNLTEISCSFFNSGCDKWFDFISEANIYIFSGGMVKENNSRYNTKNDYQLTFDERSTILAVKDDGSIVKQKFFFVKINQIADFPLGNCVDIIAIIKEPGESAQITLKSGEMRTRRNMHVYDETLASIEITLWGDLANREFISDSILILKQLRIGEYNSNRNLSNSFSTQIITDCEEFPEYKVLASWLQQNDPKNININITDKGGLKAGKLKTLAKLEEESTQKLLEVSDKLFSDVKAYIVFIRNNETATLYYLSCPTDKCMRKVVEDSDGWRCEKCNKSFPEPIARFILSGKISDDTASAWVSIYDPIASLLIGKTANEIKLLREQGQSEIVNNFFKNLQCVELRMKIMSKMEMYNGETKVKHQILKIYSKDFVQENKSLLSQMDVFFKK